MTNRGMKSRADSDGNPVNSRDNVSFCFPFSLYVIFHEVVKWAFDQTLGMQNRMLTDHKQEQPHLLNEEEYPSLSVSISSKPKSKRRTQIDLGTPCKQRLEDVQNIVPLQFEASTSISHQNDTYLPTSFGKKRSPSSSRNRENYREHGESKRSSMFSPGPNIGEPFDICSPETRESNPLKRSANGKHSGKRWVPKVQSAEENDEQHKGNMEKNNNVDESVEEAEQVLRPGMVLFKRYIPISEQVEIVKRCRELGCGPGGFYRPGYEDGAKLRLYMMCLGLDWNPQTREYGERRQYDNVAPPDIPHEFASLVSRVLNDSHALIKREMKTINVEDILPPMSPDVCIVNFYTTTGRLGLHQDRDESKESLLKGLPVVSISIGDSAEFLYGDRRDVNEAEHVLLESGDVLVFGGASRHIFHGVKNIIPNTAPHGLLKHTKLRPGRLNLTFRKY
ncbi:hypothetical protein DH2020_036794 [Rehmannia glutinosa]|uniref:Fe2OG dioxygenase domain-containing protein n=1 Tax=Rehmannia glutinosa TaxID=99300 RepID=A0ABR0V583_REHGL